jgi:hypothetical protein
VVVALTPVAPPALVLALPPVVPPAPVVAFAVVAPLAPVVVLLVAPPVVVRTVAVPLAGFVARVDGVEPYPPPDPTATPPPQPFVPTTTRPNDPQTPMPKIREISRFTVSSLVTALQPHSDGCVPREAERPG